jgi:hypothetical protein
VTAIEKSKARWPKFRIAAVVVGCILVFQIIIAQIDEHLNPSLTIKGSTGKLHVIEYDAGTAKNAGWDVAREIWNAAREHPDLREIDVEVELHVAGGGLVDKYGNKVAGPYIMGVIPVRDLDEVRRYLSEGAYIGRYQDEYTVRVGGLKYAYLLQKE